MTQPASVPPTVSTVPTPAPTERGWGKLLIAVVAFLIIPAQLGALLPINQAMMLLVPAIAACALVGWWAGGRPFLAIAWVAIATLMTVQTGTAPSPFYNLARGWSLLLAGSFGLVCLFTMTRPLFTRALLALGITLALATVMSLLGPVKLSQARKTVADEFARRDADVMAAVNGVIQAHPKEWADLSAKIPRLATFPDTAEKELAAVSKTGVAVFPALLALQSLAALALAWAIYHRLGRARLGAPLRPLREFRFNDQLVWGLIVGLTIVLLPTLTSVRGFGKNLLVFFGALYAIRGFGVLSWFLAPGVLAATLMVGFAMLWWPVLSVVAISGFVLLTLAAFGLGLGDTWADWRRRARPST